MSYIEAKIANMALGAAVGFGAALLGKRAMNKDISGVAQPVNSYARPILKATLKSGIQLYEKGRHSIAVLAETVEDVVAEARTEVQNEQVAARVDPAASPASATGADLAANADMESASESKAEGGDDIDGASPEIEPSAVKVAS